MSVNLLIFIVCSVMLILLFYSRLHQSRDWQATVTPLASIIGSGFLVAAPLLADAVNGWALLAIIGIVLLAYAIGSVIRYNIQYAEPLLNQRVPPTSLLFLDQTSNIVLSIAYIISVAFYIRLLAAFLLKPLEIDSELIANITTTFILIIIALIGLFRGLNGLERLEKISVNIKLAIIAALLAGLAWFDFHWFANVNNTLHYKPIENWPHALQLLAGILLIVQGFETSRYLGAKYDAKTRIRTMRNAQLISGVIYVLSIALLLPLLNDFTGAHNETAIIGLSALVATALPVMLIIAALMSQFSAAVADTAGAGGLLNETSRRKFSPRYGYCLVSLFAIILIWTTSIFEIISIASRAFAIYYFLQCLVALKTSQGQAHHWQKIGFVLMASVLLLIVVFAIPSDG